MVYPHPAIKSHTYIDHRNLIGLDPAYLDLEQIREETRRFFDAAGHRPAASYPGWEGAPWLQILQSVRPDYIPKHHFNHGNKIVASLSHTWLTMIGHLSAADDFSLSSISGVAKLLIHPEMIARMEIFSYLRVGYYISGGNWSQEEAAQMFFPLVNSREFSESDTLLAALIRGQTLREVYDARQNDGRGFHTYADTGQLFLFEPTQDRVHEADALYGQLAAFLAQNPDAVREVIANWRAARVLQSMKDFFNVHGTELPHFTDYVASLERRAEEGLQPLHNPVFRGLEPLTEPAYQAR
ncbi:MAG: hypothetical protein V1735_06425 [Nanoarchaeota archaeon]